MAPDTRRDDILPGMNDGFAWWLILVGLAIGVVVSWLLLVRIPRETDDIGPAERAFEADWISRTIERHGGVAPPMLVEEILELHEAYLRMPPPDLGSLEPDGSDDRLEHPAPPTAGAPPAARPPTGPPVRHGPASPPRSMPPGPGPSPPVHAGRPPDRRPVPPANPTGGSPPLR